jgi:hypothetical protein
VCWFSFVWKYFINGLLQSMSFATSKKLCTILAFTNMFFAWFNKSNANLIIALGMIWYVIMVEIMGLDDEV